MSDNKWEEILRIDNMLSGDNETPFYTQILTVIKKNIKSGVLKPGDMIPGELELCKMYGVSRTTVRQALDVLAEENLIIRRRGKGSFVANPKLHRNLDHLYNFTDDMRRLSLEPHSKVIENKFIKSPESIANALEVPVDSEVFKLVRLRCASGEPILLETTYVPEYLCPGIDREDFNHASLYEVLRLKYNLNMTSAVETYEAVKLTKEAAGLLKCKAGDAAFNVHRTAYADNDIPFEYTSSLVRSDKCIFKVELKPDRRQIHFSRQINP